MRYATYECDLGEKEKRMTDGTIKLKRRLCIRGFLDPQSGSIASRSSIATRLSQRMRVRLTVLMDYTLGSWDVGDAFLKGFDFKTLQQKLASESMSSPLCKVSMRPPSNVWRLCRKMDCFAGASGTGIFTVIGSSMCGLRFERW